MFSRSCPKCNKKISFKSRFRLFAATTITCSHCQSVLKLNTLFFTINLYFSSVISGILMAYLSMQVWSIVPMIFLINSIISLFVFSFEEAEYLD
jgi:CXXC-20-CXXC protein